jgi:hypothetical protein
MTHIAIEILGLAGLYYAQNLVHNPAIPPVINDAIPSYQTNNEDGVVLQLAQNLIGQMDANRQNRNTLSAGPLQVTLNAPLGLLPFTLFVRMEVSIS